MDVNLKNGTLLQGGKYKILNSLGKGGFGITYLAENTTLNHKVAIKELFLDSFFNRDEATNYVNVPVAANLKTVEHAKKKFLSEAKTLFGLNHPGIVRVHDAFEENGTLYYVMDYIDGGSLDDMVKRRGAIPEAEAVGYIMEVAGALSYIHSKKINHLDIKPSNLMKRREDGRTLIIDFGISKQYDIESGNGFTTTNVCVSNGYSPNEQYRPVKSFAPKIDVYSLAATLYKLLTGETPPHAYEVEKEGVPQEKLLEKGTSHAVIEAIDEAMRSEDLRTGSIEGFMANLKSGKVRVSEGETKTMGSDASTTTKIDGGATTIIKKPESLLETKRSFTVNGVSFAMIGVQGGTFTMGTTPEQQNPFQDEKPAHQVTLSDYYIGETQVTQKLWKAVMGSNPSVFEGENLPVEGVSWNKCQEFVKKLNEMTGEKFRLPTEAEWEFAARGGIKSQGYRYSGSNNLDEVAWYDDNSGEFKWLGFKDTRQTQPVATKKPNELGLYDMSGNVYEWCQDRYGKYSDKSQSNPTGPATGSSRVYRGGCWYSKTDFCHLSFRNACEPNVYSPSLGLRLALSL
ncbi:MAG: bifunctional serine/threonine-protein kinase/formylglycine-generating enzyme family protein [Muribaculaceae bacterium]|nr:bifunctional serine/threonine-protein kinase/formylglycine-generating enzyme family protein [Muribaculaceae bacterium]